MARGTGRARQLFNVGQWQAADGRRQAADRKQSRVGGSVWGDRGGGEGAAWTAMIDLAQAGASWTVGGRAGAGRGLIGRDREGTTLSGGEDTSTAWSRRRSVAGGQGGDEIGAGLGQDWDTGGRGARVGRVGQWWAWRRLMSCLHEQVPVAERAGHAVPQVRRLAVGQQAWLARRLGPMRPDNSRQSVCLPACLHACLPACLLAWVPGEPF
jgi:hypothetical protein